MLIECLSNCGFEDQLTPGKLYRVKELGQNSYLIVNDKRQSYWYGLIHFQLKPQLLSAAA